MSNFDQDPKTQIDNYKKAEIVCFYFLTNVWWLLVGEFIIFGVLLDLGQKTWSGYSISCLVGALVIFYLLYDPDAKIHQEMNDIGLYMYPNPPWGRIFSVVAFAFIAGKYPITFWSLAIVVTGIALVACIFVKITLERKITNRRVDKNTEECSSALSKPASEKDLCACRGSARNCYWCNGFGKLNQRPFSEIDVVNCTVINYKQQV